MKSQSTFYMDSWFCEQYNITVGDYVVSPRRIILRGIFGARVTKTELSAIFGKNTGNTENT